MYTKDDERYKILELQLQKAMTECGRLQEENERLKSLLGLPPKELTPCSQTINSNQGIYSLIETDLITNVSSPDKKVAFFRSLFKGREDVYPVRWQGKNSKSGYSPACANEWKQVVCRKPHVKCLDCEHRELLPVTNLVIHDHLAGKHTLAAWLIAARKVNTLVLVHRTQLMDQWRERLAVFLDIPLKSIGQVGGGKDKRTGLIDVGIIQSLSRKGVVKDLIADYGQVFVDECHHLSAFSFEQVLKQAKAKYVYGLTATPVRKDGHHPIIMMQCGPIRFRVDARKQASARPFDHVVIPRYTNFMIPPGTSSQSIQEVYAALASDECRNDLIFDDLLMALEAGRSPILLTERTGHVDYFAKRLKGFARNVIVLRGGMGKNSVDLWQKKLPTFRMEKSGYLSLQGVILVRVLTMLV